MGKQSRQFLSNRVSRSQSSRAFPAATSTARARVSFARPRPRRSGTNERAAPSTSHARPIQMSATMASANLRATGVAPRVASRDASARVATMFRSAGPNAEKKLGDAMVAAAGKFGAKHQMEVRAALSEDAPSGVRREFLKKALLGVRLPLDRARAIATRASEETAPPTSSIHSLALCDLARPPARRSRAFPLTSRPLPPRRTLIAQAAAVMPAAAANAADDQGVASSRMSYSRFLVRAATNQETPWRFPRLSRDLQGTSLFRARVEALGAPRERARRRSCDRRPTRTCRRHAPRSPPAAGVVRTLGLPPP